MFNTRFSLTTLTLVALLLGAIAWLPGGRGTGWTAEDERELWSQRHAIAFLEGAEVVELRFSELATDADFADVGRLHRLRVVMASDARLTDAAIEHLRDHPSLEMLWLTGTEITDRSLTDCRSMKNLRSLSVVDTRATAAAARELRRLKPELGVYGGGPK
jgi:hypothetical protein